MACSKYILTNTGSTIINFNYQRCEDALWEYQVELEPLETKTIWLLNNTYSSAFVNQILLTNEGSFPPPPPSPTPTQTPTTTPTMTPTNTSTPTNTPTSSLTPTNTTTPTGTPTETPTGTPTGTPTETPTGTPTGTPTETPTNTPTTSLTPTNTSTPPVTPTNTITPSVTPTNTITPSVTPTSPLETFILSSGVTANEACLSLNSVTLYAFDPLFDQNVQFYNEPNGTVTINLSGFYSDGSAVTELGSGGNQIGSFSLCSVVPTPTTTSTPTETPTETPTGTPTGTPNVTPTQTQTSTPTPTISYYVYSLGYDASNVATACSGYTLSPSNYYAPVIGGVGPNVGETLYSDTGLSVTVPDGYYSNGVAWYQVTGGSGLITSSDPDGCTLVPLEIILEGFYFSGSVGAGYSATANQPLDANVTVNFTNVLGTFTGSSLLISGSVEILSGQTSGYTQTFTDYDYNNLTQESSFTGITFDVSGSTIYEFSGETSGTTFNVTPTPTPTNTLTATPSVTPSATTTPTVTTTVTPSATPSATTTPTVTTTATPSATSPETPTPTPTNTSTPTTSFIPTFQLQNFNSNFVTVTDISGQTGSFTVVNGSYPVADGEFLNGTHTQFDVSDNIAIITFSGSTFDWNLTVNSQTYDGGLGASSGTPVIIPITTGITSNSIMVFTIS